METIILVYMEVPQIVDAIEEEFTKLRILFTDLPESQVNTIPYEGSWTPAQLVQHVALSTGALANAIHMEAKPAKRDPGEKIEMLKKTFLDFSTRMNSPDFIKPEAGPLEKKLLLNELANAVNALRVSTENANFSDLVEGLPMGAITKLEIVHFVWYHTQRHLNQMRKICAALGEG